MRKEKEELLKKNKKKNNEIYTLGRSYITHTHTLLIVFRID